ncbi:WRKY transcription factor 19 [Phytophthora cinnamomi]|uniref:WRKY transcription factor 19 n=1 Tax=Phytophthora cinnamomi TaxID=4785 RepID=UPI00355A9689|nr:WRKY transcription factor 19 [Phytophthora cinnamomi]
MGAQSNASWTGVRQVQSITVCWKHGGCIECSIDGCSKKAKARGRCWSHGGGTKCQHPDCLKVTISKGFCWAHGGGKRCKIAGCIKPAFERTQNYCEWHFSQLLDSESVFRIYHSQAP